jgi:hypothetical protein
MSTNENKPDNGSPEPVVAVKVGLSRRALLSGAGRAAVPAIVTLYSGAAMARSSANLISADATPGAENDKYRCLDTQSVAPTGNPNVYDVGSPPMAHVTRISSQRTYYKAGWNGQPTQETVAGPTMCSNGGTYYRKDWNGGFQQVSVKKGVLVSATALGSFANSVTYTDV